MTAIMGAPDRRRYAGLADVMKKTLERPAHPERICWGCDKYCPADDLACGNGTIRTPHPCELFGDDWLDWTESRKNKPADGDA
jgi:hypothetical protein